MRAPASCTGCFVYSVPTRTGLMHPISYTQAPCTLVLSTLRCHPPGLLHVIIFPPTSSTLPSYSSAKSILASSAPASSTWPRLSYPGLLHHSLIHSSLLHLVSSMTSSFTLASSTFVCPHKLVHCSLSPGLSRHSFVHLSL